MMIMMSLLLAVTTMARPGFSKPVQVAQPDGSFVTLIMQGDEFMSYLTTTDGYTVVKNAAGFYCYAEKTGALLQSTDVVARDSDGRSVAEKTFLLGYPKHLHPEMSAEAKDMKERASQLYLSKPVATKSGLHRAANIWTRINYKNFKGLVILVEFNDRKFTTDNSAAFYQRLTSEKNLVDTSKEHYPVDVMGSVRDYFYDNSLGVFDPTFDVVGPVQIDYSCTYPCPRTSTGETSSGYSNRISNIIKAAMTQVNSEIDFNNYDLNSDGVIDMVYFIFAGYGSYVQGNNYQYIWPHASDLTSYAKWTGWRYDGKYMGRYACSTEIQDYEEMASQHVWLDGIGTMCHEFSHVLGLGDHYDTDYETNGQSDDPGGWDIMANGSDYNYGLTPVGYNAFERHILGFVEPQKLELEGSYELQPFNTSNKCFILSTGTTNDDFYLENRQQQGWDKHLPASGLLVWRAETTNSSVWSNNTANANAEHNYFELLRSVPGKALESAYTPFPGQAGITDLTNTTNPALLSWSGQEAVQDLYDISETDGIITFNAGKNLYETVEEDFEKMALTTADATDQPGVFSNWTLTKTTIEAVENEKGNGQQVAVIQRSGELSSSALSRAIRKLSFTVWAGSQKIKVGLRIYQDGKWTYLNTTTGQQQVEIAKNGGPTVISYSSEIPAGIPIQIRMLSTSTSALAYVDDLQISLGKSESSGIHVLQPSTAVSQAAFSLSGTAVSADYKGVIVHRGKKKIAK